uniref:Uncharacterized protein n=1 Tax=viral metagenome TaxID=1070528 RepID=A0A6M3IWK9_9ZZZZ
MPHFAWEQYGIAGVVIGVLFFILWKMLIWVMKWTDKQSDQHLKERESWLVIMNGLRTSLELHNQSSIESRKQLSEAHGYQRAEHKEMMEVLGRINGYKDGR